MVTSLMMIVAGVSSLANGNKSARYFLLAWVVLLAGVLITSLRNFGLLTPNFLTVNSIKIGAIMEVILLSMALSDKYNLFKRKGNDSGQNAAHAAGSQ
ncbi:MAG: 7TM-DISM domain-containing protein [Haliscomenobacter sp.]|nr:7TM-DISM domain-containing protein [Haliscomenobacter sp.]